LSDLSVERKLFCSTIRTIQTRLYQDALSKRDVTAVIPDQGDQSRLDDLIQGLLGNCNTTGHQHFLENVAIKSGCAEIVLGCTDLQLAFASNKHCVDSMEVLAEHTAATLR